MGMEYWDNFVEQFEKLTLKELKGNIQKRIYANESVKLNAALFVIEEKEKEEQKLMVEKSLRLSRKLVQKNH